MRASKKHINQKKGLFVIILLLLFLPLIQQNLSIFSKSNLKGSYELTEKPRFSIENWLNNKFQSQSQLYLNDHFGFRPFFVRIYNQIHYSFYNIAKANGVIVGKDNYLFEENYIKAHLGLDFIGEKAIKEKVFKLKKIQDTLATKGIELIVMLAPGKASFYPEYIPDSYFENRNDSTNYKFYKKEIRANKIKLLDFNKWFIELKDTIHYKLFPKNGTHWSTYSQFLVTDSLIRYLNKITAPKRFPQLELDHVLISSKMRDQDQDIEDGMNLLFDIPDNEMAYPKIREVNCERREEPKLLTVADSYYKGIFKLAKESGAIKKSMFWFYNKQVFPHADTIDLRVEDVDIQKEIESNDIILLLATDANLFKFAFGFIDNVYDLYFTKLEDRKSYKREQRILNYVEEIRNDPIQNQKTREKSIRKGLSFEEELRNNAKYRIWVEDGKP